MKIFCLHMNPTVRFRRWSRKRYAAFRSIGVCINIGTLQHHLAETSLSKQHETADTAHGNTCQETDGFPDSENSSEPLRETSLFILCSQPPVSAPHGSDSENSPHYQRRTKRHHCPDAAFFIFKPIDYVKRITA